MNASNSSFQRNWVSMLIANGKQYRYRGSNFRIEPFPRTPQFRRLKGTCFRIQKYKLSTLKMRYKVEKISLSLYISTTCYLARSLWIISFAKEESSEKKTGGDYFGNPDIIIEILFFFKNFVGLRPLRKNFTLRAYHLFFNFIFTFMVCHNHLCFNFIFTLPILWLPVAGVKG